MDRPADEDSEVFAMKRDAGRYRLSRRSLLAAAGAAAACAAGSARKWPLSAGKSTQFSPGDNRGISPLILWPLTPM